MIFRSEIMPFGGFTGALRTAAGHSDATANLVQTRRLARAELLVTGRATIPGVGIVRDRAGARVPLEINMFPASGDHRHHKPQNQKEFDRE